MGLRAIVRDGHLVLRETTTLPEGTVVDLVVADDGDDLDETERAALHAHLRSSWEASQRDELIPAEDVLTELRRRS
jgi:hypothetical protein